MLTMMDMTGWFNSVSDDLKREEQRKVTSLKWQRTQETREMHLIQEDYNIREYFFLWKKGKYNLLVCLFAEDVSAPLSFPAKSMRENFP